MTVLAGLRCVDGAVLACDAQETRGNYFRFWPKANLVGKQFVTLYAGDPTLGGTFARRLGTALREADKDGPVDQPKAVELIEQVIFLMAREGGAEAIKGRQILIGGATSGETSAFGQ